MESNAQSNEIEKFKLHINEIDTITSILLKLSHRLAKIENDLLLLSDNDEQNKVKPPFPNHLISIFLPSRQIYSNDVKKSNKNTMKQNR